MSPNRHADASAELTRILLDDAATALLAPFLRGPHSVQEAAQELRRSRGQLYPWVDRFRRLGLLAEAGRRKHGRQITRLYAAAPGTHLFPFERCAHASFPELLQALDPLPAFTHHAARALEGTAHRWGVQVTLHPSGQAVRTLVPLAGTPAPQGEPAPLQSVLSPQTPALWRSDASLSLDHERAKELQRELAALIGRYRRFQTQGESSATHLLILGITPLSPGGDLG